jgi:hypothetical protein
MLKVAFAQVPGALTSISQVLTVPKAPPFWAKKLIPLLAGTLVGFVYAMLLPIAGLVLLAWIAVGPCKPKS